MSIEGMDKWARAQAIRDIPKVNEVIQTFSHDSTGDNATGMVIEIIDALADEPIPMVLYCPACGTQHIDKDNHDEIRIQAAELGIDREGDRAYSDWLEEHEWHNPPHRTHQCQQCKFEWRPADVPTTGVARIESKPTPSPIVLGRLIEQQKAEQRLRHTYVINVADLASNLSEADRAEFKERLRKTITRPLDIKAEPLPSEEVERALQHGRLREKESNRAITHNRAVRVADILRDLRNSVMEISIFRWRKGDVLRQIDEARSTVVRVIEGDLK